MQDNKKFSSLSTIGAGLVIIALGFGFWAYYQGLIPFLRMRPEAALEKTFDELSKLESTKFVAKLKFSSEERKEISQANYPAVLDPSMAFSGHSVDDVYKNLPLNVDVEVLLDGVNSVKSGDGYAKINGKLSFSGISFSSNIDLLKKGNVNYFRINEFPALGSLRLGDLKEKWVKIMPDDFSGRGSLVKEIANAPQPQTSQMLAAVVRLIKEEKIFTVMEELPRERDKNGTYYHYLIKIEYQKLAGFYEKINGLLKNELGLGEDLLDQNLITYLRSPEFLKTGEWSNNHNKLEVWIDSKNLQLRKIKSDSLFLPPENIEKLKKRQYRSVFSLELSNFNKPVEVNEPGDSITLKDMERLLTNKK